MSVQVVELCAPHISSSVRALSVLTLLWFVMAWLTVRMVLTKLKPASVTRALPLTHPSVLISVTTRRMELWVFVCLGLLFSEFLVPNVTILTSTMGLSLVCLFCRNVGAGLDLNFKRMG